MNPLLYVDSYKIHHHRQYPDGMSLLYSNLTPRKSRLKGVNKVVFFGLQHFILEYLIEKFNKEFFKANWKDLDSEYTRHNQVDIKHIRALYILGYLPIEIKALSEGTLCPIGVPCLTIKNTHPKFAWLTNYLETLISCQLWQPITSATIANEYKQLLSKYAIETTGSSEGVQWQGHDFSMRGMSSVESAILSGMAHLTSFTGTDTIPALYQLERSYGATGLIGASVPATEHSVMCMGNKESELETFKRLLTLYPTGILSVVSDTWDLWTVLTEYLPKLKEEILARDGKLVIRPDSGDPVDIICGIRHKPLVQYPSKYDKMPAKDYTKQPDFKGVIELLWDIFGGTTNKYGYKELNSHIGAIYGDSITLDRAKEICERLKAKGFASTNVVLGIASYTYQYNTRDTFGFAMKATYGEVNIGDKVDCREIFKDPITDDGTKRSAKGLLCVDFYDDDDPTTLKMIDQCDWEEEESGQLKTVFKNGKLLRTTTLDEIRHRLASAVLDSVL